MTINITTNYFESIYLRKLLIDFSRYFYTT